MLILTCSGTGALEAAVVNYLSPGDRVLSVSIGVFGDRFAKIATRYGADVTKLRRRVGPRRRSGRRRALRSGDGTRQGTPAKAVLVTLQRDLDRRDQPARGARRGRSTSAAPDALILVDGISGLGADPVRDRRLGPRRRRHRLAEELDGAARPGHGQRLAARLGGRRSAPPCRASTSTSPRTATALAKGETPWTPAVGVCFALDVALELIEAEGYPADLRAPRRLRRGRPRRPDAHGLPALRGPAVRLEHGHRARWLPDGVEWSALNKALRGARPGPGRRAGQPDRQDLPRRPPGAVHRRRHRALARDPRGGVVALGVPISRASATAAASRRPRPQGRRAQPVLAQPA